MLSWIAAVLAGRHVSARRLAQRGDISIAWLARLVTNLLMIRAGQLRPFGRGRPQYWRHGRDLRRSHFVRSILGAKLRRALRHKDLVTQIARLINVLTHLDTYAVRLAHNLRRRGRLWHKAPSIAPAAPLLGAPAPSPALADSS